MLQRKVKKIMSIFALVALIGTHAHVVYGKNLEKGNPVSMYYDEEITLADDRSIEVGEDYVALFMNGTFVPHDCVVTKGDTLLVPIRLISEELSYLVGWEQKNKEITLMKGTDQIVLRINDKKAWCNKQEITLDDSPALYEGNAYIPLTFIADYLDCTVKYVPELEEPYTYYYDTEMPMSSSDTLIRSYPNIIIDEKYDQSKSISREEALKEAQKVCREGLQNFKKTMEEKLLSQGEASDRFHTEFIAIEKEIDRMLYIGEVSRYYKFTIGAYDVLVDKYTHTIFFEIYSSGVMVKKVDVHDPELFIAVFIVG